MVENLQERFQYKNAEEYNKAQIAAKLAMAEKALPKSMGQGKPKRNYNFKIA